VMFEKKIRDILRDFFFAGNLLLNSFLGFVCVCSFFWWWNGSALSVCANLFSGGPVLANFTCWSVDVLLAPDWGYLAVLCRGTWMHFFLPLFIILPNIRV
jgi:hypothetical protein